MTSASLKSRRLSRSRFAIAAAITVLLVAWVSASASSSSAKTPRLKSNGLTGKTPAQILAAAQAALRSARSFVVAGDIVDGKQTSRISVVFGGSDKIKIELDQSGDDIQILGLDGKEYLRANRKFWVAQGGTKLASFANKWIVVPDKTAKQLTASLGPFAPATLAECLGQDVGTLSSDGTATVDGQAAVVIKQAGDVPGGNPGTLAVAASGPAYPLRITATGRTRPGGKVDTCNDGKGGDDQGNLTLSDFNHAPALSVPANPVNLTTSTT
jgi:hypothetical protein